MFSLWLGQGRGTRARGVLEVRRREIPFVPEQGQVVGGSVHERGAEAPITLYVTDHASNQQGRGPKLSKHFR